MESTPPERQASTIAVSAFMRRAPPESAAAHRLRRCNVQRESPTRLSPREGPTRLRLPPDEGRHASNVAVAAIGIEALRIVVGAKLTTMHAFDPGTQEPATCKRVQV